MPILNIVSTGKKEELVNISTVTLEYGKDYYFAQSAAANDFNINLPQVTSELAALSKYQTLAMKLFFGGIGGKTAKIFNVDGSQIVATSRNYTTIEFVLYNNVWVTRLINAPEIGAKVASVTYDPPSLATAAQQSTTVTLTGAKLGDNINVSFNQPLQGTRMWGEVTATNTVTVYHRNDTGAAVDLPSGTLTVKIV